MDREVVPLGLAVLALGGGLGAAVPLLLYPDRDLGGASAAALTKRQALPPCGGDTPAVECLAGSTVVRTAVAPKPVVMSDVEARTLRASLDGRRLEVRVRIRNATPRLQEVNAVGRQLEVRLADHDHIAARREEPLLLPPGEAATTTLRFALGPQAAEEFRTRPRAAQLRVLPFAAQRAGLPARSVGVVRFGRSAT